MTDERAYWLDRGRTFLDDYRLRASHVEQERAITAAVARIRPASVLDVACGFGRIGRIVLRSRPVRSYLGIDISPEQIAHAERYVGDRRAAFRVMAAEDLPPAAWDLVIAVEFLMHVPPSDIEATVARLRAAGRWLLTVDWDRPRDKETAPHNFLHDYAALYGPTAQRVAIGDLQGLYLVAP